MRPPAGAGMAGGSCGDGDTLAYLGQELVEEVRAVIIGAHRRRRYGRLKAATRDWGYVPAVVSMVAYVVVIGALKVNGIA